MLSIELLQAAIALNNDGVAIAEYGGGHNPIVFANSALTGLTGYGLDELKGQDYRFLVGQDDQQAALEELNSAILSSTECCVKLRNYTKDGRLFWTKVSIGFCRNDAKVTHLITISQDITQQEYIKNVLDKITILYREMSKRLEYTNETDSLTNLKNRGHLSTRGEFILGAAKREKMRLHAIIVDVDNFKTLNTLGGYSLGDGCLVKVANIISRFFCRATDIAIRMCDDEFVIICIEDDDNRVLERAEILRSEIRAVRVKDLDSRTHEISVSIGIYSVTPEKNTTIEEMVHNAGQLVFQGAYGKRDCISHHKANDCS